MFKFVLSLFFTTAAFAHDCDSFLQSANLRALVKKVTQLNPEIHAGESVEDLYLALKRESSVRTELSGTLVQHLRVSQAKHYSVESLDLFSLTIFYRNALRALEHRAAAIWREQEIKRLVGDLSSEQIKFAGHLLDAFFSPNTLNDDSLTPEEAQRYFNERPWRNFDWASALVLDYSKFNWNEVNRINLARGKGKRAGECCLSRPGCTLCPHNRAWLN